MPWQIHATHHLMKCSGKHRATAMMLQPKKCRVWTQSWKTSNKPNSRPSYKITGLYFSRESRFWRSNKLFWFDGDPSGTKMKYKAQLRMPLGYTALLVELEKKQKKLWVKAVQLLCKIHGIWKTDRRNHCTAKVEWKPVAMYVGKTTCLAQPGHTQQSPWSVPSVVKCHRWGKTTPRGNCSLSSLDVFRLLIKQMITDLSHKWAIFNPFVPVITAGI